MIDHTLGAGVFRCNPDESGGLATYVITHQPSGDEAEAETEEAAITAARTLLLDNEDEGTCRIWLWGCVKAVMWGDKNLEEA